MSTSRYGKGSWIYKILIVLLTAALAGSIYYPKKLWEKERLNTEECRNRLTNIFNAELFYQHFRTDFTDSLNELIEFVKYDSSYHAYIDSTVGEPLQTLILELDTLRQRQLAFENTFSAIDTSDSTQLAAFNSELEDLILENRLLRDRMEALREEMKRHPNFPLAQYDAALDVIERKDFFLQYEIIRNMIAQGRPQDAYNASNSILADFDTIEEKLEDVAAGMPSMYALADSMHVCPTTRTPYNLEIALIDSTNMVREVVVECPIDTVFIDSIKSDFLLSTVGALEIENHGRVKGGEKSWEEGKK